MIAFQMKKLYLSLFFLSISFFSISEENKPLILISIAPHRAFVKAIAGDTVTTQLIVPPGTSSHTFEPTPKEVIQASKANIWFSMGEFFEKRFYNSICNFNKGLILEDLREGVELIKIDSTKAHCTCSHHLLTDLHIWLSPKEVKVQARKIARVLSKLNPSYEELYQKNLENFLQKIDQTDLQIKEILSHSKARYILVSHPAYAYFCRDYGLMQISVESEGKDPTAKQLTELLKKATQEGIKVVFTQPQYNNKGTHLIAKELGAEVVTIDPYSENFLDTLLLIVKKISN